VTLLAPEPTADPTPGGDTLDERPTTLKPVLDVISPERYRNPTWKGLLYVARDLVLYGLLVWGLIVADAWWAVLGLWGLSAFVISGLFIIGHDAAHGALFRSKRLNSIVGHVMMLPSWHVYEGWVLGHNRIHHGHTCRQSMDFVWHPLTPDQYAALPRWQQLRHRIEWSWLGSMPYYLRDVWWNKMIAFDPPENWARQIKRDRLIVLGFVGAASLALGALGLSMYGSVLGALWMIVKVLVVPFLAFIFTIGWVVHVHHIDPEITWWKRREWNKFRGQMEGTTMVLVPAWLDFFLHRIFFHVAHHVDMRIPFYELPAACEEIRQAFPDVVVTRRLRLRDFLANTRQCKLYDFDAGRWLTYAEARAQADPDPAAVGGGWSGTNSF
jgi:omega-6 fatty acid desaturase (delta-12 desaturase)